MKLQDLFTFQGRMPPGPYWKWMAATTVASLASVVFVSMELFALITSAPPAHSWAIATTLALLVLMQSTISAFAAIARRLHDAGQSAAWTLVSLLPSGYLILVLVAGILPSQREANAYGPA